MKRNEGRIFMGPKKFLAAGMVFLALAHSIEARPVRVLFLKFVYPGGFIYSSIKNGTPQLEAMLVDPAGQTGAKSLVNSTLGTGDTIVVPKDGFRIDTIGNGTNATPANIAKLISLLDSLDVLVMSNNVGFGGILKEDSDRVKFLNFAATKGIVALMGANDPHSSSSAAPTWIAYDSLCGALFKDWARGTTDMLQDSLPFNTTDSNFQVLNQGLLPGYRINHNWMSYTKNPRNQPEMHILYTLNEASYNPSTRMGDHPISWYRYDASGQGGRYFYTGLGFDDTLYSKNYLFRRQVYNAIVWAGKVAPNGAVAVRSGMARASTEPLFRAVAERGNLTVTPLKTGSYKVEIRALDGRRIGSSEARDGQPTTFSLRAHALYSITVESGQARRSTLVALP